jgi:hypothetical protein
MFAALATEILAAALAALEALAAFAVFFAINKSPYLKWPKPVYIVSCTPAYSQVWYFYPTFKLWINREIVEKTEVLEKRRKLAIEALKYVGSHAIYYDGPEKGMSPTEGFDCSGFPTFLLKEVGFPNPENLRHVNEYFDRFGVFVHYGLQDAGDLVFFSWGGIYPRHMGILVSPERYVHVHQGKRRIEARNLKQRIIEPTEGQIYNVNPIGFKRPAIRNDRFHML